MLKLITFPLVILSSFVMMSYSTAPAEYRPNIIPNPLKPFKVYTPSIENKKLSTLEASTALYKQWELAEAGLSADAFNYAMKGFDYLAKANQLSNKNILSIVDFSKPSTEKRLFIIDVNTGKMLFNTYVAHGRNSGDTYANQFSNLPESHQSSLGFYVTKSTYFGKHGLSLRIDGCEKGINEKALERAIVVHGADYVSNQFINNRGALGRSYGCPAIPNELTKSIIEVIKNGTCLFLYHPTKKYIESSKIIASEV